MSINGPEQGAVSPVVQSEAVARMLAPGVIEFRDGRIGFIGPEAPPEIAATIPPGEGGAGPDERLIVVPREALLEMIDKIPDN